MKNNEDINKQFICDHCGQVFEINYKCEKCSDKIVTELVEKRNLNFFGYPSSDEYFFEEEDFFTGNVCGNCCICSDNEKITIK